MSVPTVFLCSAKIFTTCCGAAITDDESNCPRCKAEIFPRSHADRWRVAYSKRNRPMIACKAEILVFKRVNTKASESMS